MKPSDLPPSKQLVKQNPNGRYKQDFARITKVLGLADGTYQLRLHTMNPPLVVPRAQLTGQFLSSWTDIFDKTGGADLWVWVEPPSTLNFELALVTNQKAAELTLDQLIVYFTGCSATSAPSESTTAFRWAQEESKRLGLDTGARLTDEEVLQQLGDRALNDRLDEATRSFVVQRGRRQILFRMRLFHRFAGSCAFCGCSIREALEAAHIVPWGECLSDADQVDASNGLLLCATHHRLFDAGIVVLRCEDLGIEVEDSGGPGMEAAIDLKDCKVVADPSWESEMKAFVSYRWQLVGDRRIGSRDRIGL